MDEMPKRRRKTHVQSVKSKFAFTWEYYPVRYFYHFTVSKWIAVSDRNMLKCVDRDVQAKPDSENRQLQSPHGTRGAAGAEKNQRSRRWRPKSARENAEEQDEERFLAMVVRVQAGTSLFLRLI